MKNTLGWLLFFSWVAALSLIAQETLWVPHFTQSPDTWETHLALVNAGDAAVHVSVEAYDASGATLGSVSLDLAAGEGRDQNIATLFPNMTDARGWLRLTGSRAGLSGLMRFQHRLGGGTASLPLFTESGRDWVLPLLTNDNTFSSGLAVVNPSDQNVSLALTLTDYAGSTPATVTRDLAPRGKLVAMARDLFGEAVPAKSSLSLRADGEVAAFALSFSPTVDQIVAVPGRQTALPALDGTLSADIQAAVTAGSLPGLAAAVVVDGKVAWQKGFGFADVAAQRPVTTQTPFLLASISKAITAVVFMKAVEQGFLTLDDPLNEYLPFVLDNPAVSGETIRFSHLLTHTSGIIDNEAVTEQSYTYGADSPISLGSFLQDYLVAGGAHYDAEANFLDAAPGSLSDYSNIASALVGYGIARATQTDFAQFSQTTLFEPLNMNHTGWFLRDVGDKQPAIPYRVPAAGRFEALQHYGFPDYPNGQCRASVADLAVFLAMVMNGGEINGTRVLTGDSVAAMQEAQPVPIPADIEAQGLMWFTMRDYGRTLVGHDGGEEGADTFMFFDPAAGIGVITLVNGDGDGLDQDALDQIRRRLFDYGAALKRMKKRS
ncbi:beta-lactamase family protein [Acanthopleuribacter pedis]|nr:beta-lactamase family protein [Acanthopleuribacter pedis]